MAPFLVPGLYSLAFQWKPNAKAEGKGVNQKAERENVMDLTDDKFTGHGPI